MRLRNQIRVLCAKCGCYYAWNIEFDANDYPNAVNASPVELNVCCPECGSNVMAQHSHHSAGLFNCGTYPERSPRYCSGPGSSLEPIFVK